MTGTPLLQSEGISMSFGGYHVLRDVTLDIAEGDVVGIIGPNGAGKTTWMNILTGALRSTGGHVRLLGEDVTRLDTASRCHLGLSRTHQVPRPFLHMTTFENVLVATNFGRTDRLSDPIDATWRVLEETGLAHVANRQAASLGLLDRKRLELSRALATRPTALLLDEIGGGLTDTEGDALVALVRQVHARGVTIVWIEHIMRLLLQTCTRLVCMAEGRVLAQGEPAEVIASPIVRSAYFGAAA